jgi:hypothetical protein
MYPNSRGNWVYPYGLGSWVYPNGWGSQVYPNGWGSQVCTLTVGAAGRGRVGAGSVLGLCPRGLRNTLTAWALPLRFALCIHGLGFALTTIK